jgi:hypothetical protein
VVFASSGILLNPDIRGLLGCASSEWHFQKVLNFGYITKELVGEMAL